MKREAGTIPESVLRKYGAQVVKVGKGETIVREGDAARSFFIVRRGQVKMVNVSEDGKEFIQGYFTNGESFGDPPFFAGEPFPASAVAVEASEVWKIGKADFLLLLRENFAIHLDITRQLGMRLIYKSIMLSELAIEEGEHRIKMLLNYFRERHQDQGKPCVVPFSRQQLADMAGLRVETVIRIVKDLEHQRVVKLTKEGKIVLD
ncbi:MAG TPA: Crp/Fnr family transcriptional regulator [Bacteroidota bacterium]